MLAVLPDLAMKMSKVGNQTNSQDPQAVNSRVFVGNLNTFQCSKTDVERMFQRYGRIAGISMHKGYAFVQFTNPFDARSACLGEDARTVLGQVLDVNMVAEPKAHQTGRKRQNMAKTGNDWDYYYDSYYSTATLVAAAPRLVPPPKRPRLVTIPTSRIPPPATASTRAPTASQLEQLKTYSNHDILICGNCREMFTDLHELLDHKKTYCKLRFTCKCRPQTNKDSESSVASLLCAQCKESFANAWELMVHAQGSHAFSIYQLPDSAADAPAEEGQQQLQQESSSHAGNAAVKEEEEEEEEGGSTPEVAEAPPPSQAACNGIGGSGDGGGDGTAQLAPEKQRPARTHAQSRGVGAGVAGGAAEGADQGRRQAHADLVEVS
ncbi:heterogeneous nuclear ribonucleoprotein C-like [Schistocerca piceifrons]|uniref:heterogeneous nuclear ribonucleoprotein C-like n=1 Tax=Schistocerca piceifrons TaxID=274613 RepID=UPI001F5E4AEF|nr:heterogeneous nuclear ribonucleoprotein C-like [Schistocerca piceifrons]